MECPSCRNEVSLESNVCPHCGHKLSREEISEQLRSPRLPGMKVEERKKWPLFVAGGVALLLIVVLVLVFAFGGGKKSGSPRVPITEYYYSLTQGDIDGMALQFGTGYGPNVDERSVVEKALNANGYRVQGPVLAVLENDGQEARVIIESLRVSAVPATGGQPHNHSVTDVLQPLQETDPNTSIIVKLSRHSGEWKIVNEPFGGWNADSFWLVGVPGRP